MIAGLYAVLVAFAAVGGLWAVLGMLNDHNNRYPGPLLLAAAVAAVLAWMILPAHARDDGRYANSELKPWFGSLKSGRGPCCSDADGSAVSDVDWESKGGHYRVRIEGRWHDVPDDAVITEPNRVGRTMVWPIEGYGGLTIRCFMPGAMG